ncbi:hypothetical protein WBK31_06650 [Nonomuraea sp. N2-4H]|uniref:hypothetical protein n=1 Tax=Nonomuraea sp. N2-4H TaxID=3128898 RepID=UPI003247A0AF
MRFGSRVGAEAPAPGPPRAQRLSHGTGVLGLAGLVAGQHAADAGEERVHVGVGPIARDAVGDVVHAEQDGGERAEVGDLVAARRGERGGGRQAAEGEPAGGAVAVGEECGVGAQQPVGLGHGVERRREDGRAVLLGDPGELMGGFEQAVC